MNKDKIIKDLKQRIDKLQKQLEEQVKYNLMLVSDDKGRDYYKNIIDKAKEWIYIVQQNKDNKHLEPVISTDELDDLLSILGGKE